MPLEDFPRAVLAHAPTPLEPMPRLGAHLGLERLYVKRDDCTGLAMGGNKARQLEYYFGEALARGADTVIVTGAVQSNYLRMTAAAAARLGMACEVQQEERVQGMDAEYHASGNVLLERIHGARVHHYPEGEDEAGAERGVAEIADRVRARGAKPYIIPLAPGHPPLGALGYVGAAAELLGQMAARGIEADTVVLASGSALTQAGMLVGLRRLGSRARVLGVCVRRAADRQGPRALARAIEVAEMIGEPGLVGEADIRVDDRSLGDGYGRFGVDSAEALLLAARLEGLLLDPVYTAKALAGLIALARAGEFDPAGTVIFLHTGGTPALFGYRAAIEEVAGFNMGTVY